MGIEIIELSVARNLRLRKVEISWAQHVGHNRGDVSNNMFGQPTGKS